jgi:putative membrane-bound dehydrogenase-like protein
MLVTDAVSFRDDYAAALQRAGARVTAANVPDEAGLRLVDAVLLHSSKFAPLPAEAQAALTAFCKRGGGLVVVNAAVASGDPGWGRKTFGGAWDPAVSRKFASRMMLYVRQEPHPIVNGASSFDLDDDTFFDLTLDDDIFVLGSAFTTKTNNSKRAEEDRKKLPGVRASIYDIQPQMWAFEGERHRAAVFLQGSPSSLKHTSMRAFIMRGLAWTLRRENVDEFRADADPAALRYPKDGPLSPAEAVRQFRMQPEFNAGVVAAEPLISKPIAVQWDARGRLWVAETPEYPNGRRPYTSAPWKDTGSLEPGNYNRPGRDSISVLEDRDGDGQMDAKRVFADDLELVTAFCMHGDGVIAASYPGIVWLRDTDGDGSADKRVPVFDGVPFPNHFVINHMVQSPDGWIYASTGTSMTLTKPGGGETLPRLSPGLFRFKANGSAIQQVASVGGNSFGMDLTSDLELYLGMATSENPIQHVVLPEWVLAKAAGSTARSTHSVNPKRRVARRDLPDRPALMQIGGVGYFSSACSSLVYEGGAWPREYEGMTFVTEPLLDIIHHEQLMPHGPTFDGRLMLDDAEWLRSMDYWFAPVDVTFGPDGAMYVLDFYTPVMAHNDTRGPAHGKSGASIRPDREHYFGRIYRIQHRDAVQWAVPDLTKAGAPELIAAFRHPNRVVRFNALRILLENPSLVTAAALSELDAMVRTEDAVPARILALWALRRLDRLPRGTLAAALRSGVTELRKNALLIAESGRIPLEPAEVRTALEDSNARVRLAALRALGTAPLTVETGAILVAQRMKATDEWSKAAAAAAGSGSSAMLLDLLLAEPESGGDLDEFARSLAAALRSGGDTAGLLRVLHRAATSANERLALVVITELAQSPPAATGGAEAVLAALRGLLVSPARADAALPLFVRWDAAGEFKSEIAASVDRLLLAARDARLPAGQRMAAVESLLGARSAMPRVLPELIGLLETTGGSPLRLQIIAALASTADPRVGSALTDAFPGLEPAERESAFRALVSRPEWSKLLLDALSSGRIAASLLGPPMKSRLTSHPDAATAKRARGWFASVNGGTSPTKEALIARLAPVVGQPGDPVKGRELFAGACASCHRLEGKGFRYGPDLDGVGMHSAAELLISIVDPNRVVDDEHATWNLTMKDGARYSALIDSENESTVNLRLPGGIRMELRADDVVARGKGGNSLMPEGLESLGGGSLRDIISYIQSAASRPAAE